MRKRKVFSVCSALVILLAITPAFGAVSAQEAERLGKDLTPMGAERAGNADGTIPAWDGAITVGRWAKRSIGANTSLGSSLCGCPC